jgi:hypothetical protein
MKKSIMLSAAVAGLSLVLAGCGSGQKKTSGDEKDGKSGCSSKSTCKANGNCGATGCDSKTTKS